MIVLCIDNSNSPDWFERVDGPAEEKPFVWTDELVTRFSIDWLNNRVKWAIMHDYSAAPVPIQIEIKKFKDSQAYIDSKKQPIAEGSGDGKGGFSVKQQPEKSYGNTGLIQTDLHLHTGVNKIACSEYELRGWEIHSVKRLSDGEVFSVGDEITFTNEAHKIKITCFNYLNECMLVGFGDDSTITSVFLDHAKKLPSNPLPVKLFTTSDMVDIFPGTPYWHIVSDWTPQMEIAVEAGRQEYGTRKMTTFSTESAANEYILLNKPFLSVKDICAWSCIDTATKESLMRLAQSKQSK